MRSVRSNPASRQPHLGSGVAFPFVPQDGSLGWVRAEACVEQAVRMVLSVAPLEVPSNPTFGAGLHRFVFEPNSPATHRTIEREVRRALIDWEYRINLEGVRVSAHPTRSNQLNVEVDYVVRATNTAFNLVFPFYLQEDGA